MQIQWASVDASARGLTIFTKRKPCQGVFFVIVAIRRQLQFHLKLHSRTVFQRVNLANMLRIYQMTTVCVLGHSEFRPLPMKIGFVSGYDLRQAFNFLFCYWNARPKLSMVPTSANFICHFIMRAIPNGLTFGFNALRLYNYRVHVLFCIQQAIRWPCAVDVSLQ